MLKVQLPFLVAALAMEQLHCLVKGAEAAGTVLPEHQKAAMSTAS
jgi:hypothetical protein